MHWVYKVATAILAVAPFAFLHAAYNPETGSPFFQHYAPDTYNASPQNWAITQDQRGVMYFGNTNGVLEFDGLSWKTIRLKNGSMAKSVAVDDKGRVLVGGQGDFGYLEPDTHGELRFVSLLDKVPAEDRTFTDVWRVLPTPAGVYFTSYARLFRWDKDGSVKVWRPQTNFGRAFYVLGAIYVKTPQQGLLKMEGNHFVTLADGAMFAKLPITDAVSLGDIALLGTPSKLYQLDRAGQVKPFVTAAESAFATGLLYTLRLLPDGEIAGGTRQGGLVLFNRDGHLDRVLTKASGLGDDHIEAIFPDAQGGVWLAGFSGLSRYNPGLSVFPNTFGLEGDAQCMTRLRGDMFVGTSSGLYRLLAAPGEIPRFQKVAGIENSVWSVQVRGKELLAATDNGVFEISAQQATQIYVTNPRGTWDVSLSQRDPAVVYIVGRAGVAKLRKEGKTWEKAAVFAPPAQEFRTVLEDPDGRVWATTRDSVWRIDLSTEPAQFQKFDAKQGLPVIAGGWINALRLQGKVTFATSKGLMVYSEDTKRFEPDASLGKMFADGSQDVFNAVEDKRGNVWVTGEKYQGVLLKNASGYQWYAMPLQSAGVKEMYGVALDDDGAAWITGAKGALYRWERGLAGNPDHNFQVLTRQIQVNQKDILYGGAGKFAPGSLPWRDNDLHFEYAAPFYEDPAAVEYQTLLTGSDRDWSPWSHQTQRDYTHLPEGDYQFQVRARTPHGTTSQQVSMAFGVLPPWYRTWWAYSIYVVVGGFGVWGIVRLRTRQLEEDKRQLEVVVEERTVEIRHQRDEIKEQERKSHALLLNILPSKVADELKSTGAVKPVGFDDVTVCFTDFVGFTLSSEKMAPGKLVNALNEYFTAFDEIIARYQLEKLKTIGDSYMFVSGLPAQRASHAVDAVMAAMEMVAVVQRISERHDGAAWGIRVGLHSGPVVAGVVGIRKFAFDIWGNTVNFAARMESSGVHGRVNMSERTCRLLRNLIDCDARGEVKIKEGRYLPMFLAHRLTADFSMKYEQEFGEPPRAVPTERVEAYAIREATQA